MDILTYTYQDGNNNSNRLMKVTDAASVGASQGFNNGNSGTSNDYTYDSNGNMLSDLNKNITNITYNFLNLPEEITFGNGSSIEYIYNAAGVKVMKTINNVNPPNVYTDYLDGFQYVGGMLNFFPTAEGYVRATSQTEDPADPQLLFNYVYNYTDHLGNIRLSYTKDLVSNELEILDESHYYPFGLKHNSYDSSILQDLKKEEEENGNVARPGLVIESPYNYKYQGQERQDELGLNWDSFKWRNYDYAIGRFMSIDPLAEQYSYQSPYNFAENRVIDGRELEGLEWTSSTSGNEVHFNVKVQVVNTVGLSDKKINKVAKRIQKDFSKTYSQVDGYSASMDYEIVDVATSDYTIEVVEQVDTPTKTFDNDGNLTGVEQVAGKAEKFADTQNNNVKVAAKDGLDNDRTAGSMSKTVQHELGHTAGLGHPWDQNANVPSDIDQNSGDVKNGTIRKNLMNSDRNPNESLRNTSGTKLTPGQMQRVEETVDKNLGN